MTLTSGHYPPGYFGPHHAVVLEVLEFAASDGFLNRSIREAAQVCVVAEDTGECIAPGVSATPIPWDDFLEFQRRAYLGRCADWCHVTRALAALQDYRVHLTNRFPFCSKNVRDAIEMLIDDCAQARCACGKGCNFWEHIFECLNAGLVPVGWRGSWPDGVLLARRFLGET
jgi:hypothetical protein